MRQGPYRELDSYQCVSNVVVDTLQNVSYASIQVEDQGRNQPKIEGGSEHMQDWELAQQIEELIEFLDMQLEREP